MAKRGHGAKSEAVRAKAIAALFLSPSLKAAAASAGVSGATLRGWLRDDPEFVRAFQDARSRTVEDAVGELLAAQGAAVETLRDCLAADADSVKVSAARALLEYALKGRELLDLEGRVTTLEERSRA